MSREFGGKPFLAEVIDMDSHADENQKKGHPGRPSKVFTQRIGSEQWAGMDEHSARFLFDDPQPGRQSRRRVKKLQKIKSLAGSLLMGIAGAWILWAMPGMGPHDLQSKTDQSIKTAESQILTLETQLAMAQARVIELTKTTKVQRDRIDQGESIRRSMAARGDHLAQKIEILMAESKADQDRMNLLAKTQESQSQAHQTQADALELVSRKLAKVDLDLVQAQKLTNESLNQARALTERSGQEQLARISSLLETRLSALKGSDMTDVRDRVERLAEHVWQEVGRLDGRIMRASGTTEKEPSK